MEYALVRHPLTATFKERLEAALESAPQYLTFQELRAMPWHRMLRVLRGLHAERLFIVLEDSGAAAMLPIFHCLAAAATAREVRICHPDLTQERVRKLAACRAFASFVKATVDGQRSVRRCRRELRELARQGRIAVDCRSAARPTGGKPVLYARSNLWIGVKAGGSVGHVAGVVNGLKAQGFGVEFAGTEPPLLVDGLQRFHRVPLPAAYGVPYDTNLYRFHEEYLSVVARAVQGGRYAFVYQRLAPASFSGVKLSRMLRVPLVLEYNGSETWVAKNWGTRLKHADVAELAEEVSLRHAHVVVTVSEVLREELIARGVEPGRIVCYPNCIDPAVFDPARFSAAETGALRKKLGIEEDGVVAGFLGTFGQWHGVEVLAEAVRKVAREEATWVRQHKLHFLIVGDGAGMPRVREILSDPACRGLATVPGLVPQGEAPSYLAACDILLSPHVNNADGSRFFGSPTKLFEYMAMSKAILASDLEQIGKVLRPAVHVDRLPDGVPGKGESSLAVLCSPGNPGELARGLRFLVEQPAWRGVLGENARREAVEKYTWEQHVRAILDGLERQG